MGIGCAGTNSASISSGSTTKLNQQKEVAGGANTAATNAVTTQAKYGDPNNPLGFSVAPPPDAPDFMSTALKQRRAAQALALLSGRGRAQAFLGGGSGSPSALSGGSL